LSLVVVVGLFACLSPFRLRGEVWRHPEAKVEVPDLGREGWRRIRLDGAQLAFQSDEEGVIALRAECGNRTPELQWAGRELWFGIPRGELAVEDREVGGRPAIEVSGEADGVRVRAVVVRSDRCLLDVAHVRPADIPDSGVLDRFLARTRMGDPE
jgi:hypothetical protein